MSVVGCELINMNLNEWLQRATKEHWALGHFNISNLEQLCALCDAAKECSSPLLIGTSEGERDFIGLRQAVALVQAFKEESGLPLFLNADHSKSVESAKKAIDAGYNSIHIDLSVAPFEENMRGTKEVVEYAQAKNQEMSIEGELGYLRGSSTIQDVAIEVKPEDYTDPAQAAEFVKQTSINRLAIAVGNIHGISLNEPAIDLERINAIRQAVPDEVVLVLHAASGIPDEIIRASIGAGIANIHINTEIRVIFSQELRSFLAANPNETTPYKLYGQAMTAMKNKVKEKLQIFGSCDKV